jgi:hypothetical protein
MVEKTTIEKFKKVMIDMYKGYPQYIYFGTFEKEFGKKEAVKIIEKLNNDGLINVDYDITNKAYYYELTSKGINFAIAMIQLNFSQKTHIFNQRIYLFTKVMVIFTMGVFFIGLIQLILTYLQNPIF